MPSLMTVVKATNVIVNEFVKQINSLPDDNIKEKAKLMKELEYYLQSVYILVARQCSYNMFFELCLLDVKYNFIGGVFVDKDKDASFDITFELKK
jgi:hypothetical protein